MALSLSLPIPATNVNKLIHRIKSLQIQFKDNGLLDSCSVGIDSYVDNVAIGPIDHDSVKITPSPAQIASVLAFLYTATKADARYVGASTIADPA
jgi:hypothetical protein